MTIIDPRTYPPAAGEEPVLASLREVGYDIGSLAELCVSGVRYRKAIPILVAALSEVTEKRALEWVVRALSVPWAKPTATGALIHLFHHIDEPPDCFPGGVHWVIGNALDVTWCDDYFDQLVDLARDRSYGRNREMIVLGLARSRRPEAGQVLIDLLDDPDVNGHATMALRRLFRRVRVPEARPGLEGMLGDKRAWVRKEAQRALAALG